MAEEQAPPPLRFAQVTASLGRVLHSLTGQAASRHPGRSLLQGSNFFSGGGKHPDLRNCANPAYTLPGSNEAREGLRFRGGGGASSPATATPTQFPLKCYAFPGAETARKQFLLRGASSPTKKLLRTRRTRRRVRLKRERAFGPSCALPGFGPSGRRDAGHAAFALQNAAGESRMVIACISCVF